MYFLRRTLYQSNGCFDRRIIYLVNIFGQVVGSTYSQLADDTVLTSNTTLYCVTENSNTPQVVWSYLNLDGIKTGLTTTTDASTGVSIIQVYTTQPGYYTCEVSQNGGNRRAYTVIMTDTHRDSGILLLSNNDIIDDLILKA